MTDSNLNGPSQPLAKPTSLGINEGPGLGDNPLGPGAAGIDLLHARWDKFRFDQDGTPAEMYWEDESKSGQQHRVVGSHAVHPPYGPDYLELTVETFTPAEATAPTTRQPIAIRRLHVGRSHDGNPIYPLRRIPAAEFVRTYHPDERKMSKSEYKHLLDENRDLIEHEQATRKGELAMFAERNVRAEQATFRALYPDQALAEAVASAVAAALATVKGAK